MYADSAYMSTRHIPRYTPGMTNKFPSDKKDRYIVRLPDGMRERIAETAKLSGRSMNAEIVLRLEKSFVEGGEIPEYIRRELVERAVVNGTSLASEIERLLDYSKDEFARWVHGALSTQTKRSIEKNARRMGHSVQKEIDRRLAQPTPSWGLELKIKSEAHLKTTAVLEFVSSLGKEIDLTRVERIEIQVTSVDEPAVPSLLNRETWNDFSDADIHHVLRSLQLLFEEVGIDFETMKRKKRKKPYFRNE